MAEDWFQLTDEVVQQGIAWGALESSDDLIPYSHLEIEHVEWVIPDLIPCGMLSVLAGEQGLGKSLLHARWASHLSKQSSASVLVSAEDSPTHTTKARLQASDANQDLVYHANILPVLGNGTDPEWMRRMEGWIRETDARLVVFDPLSAFLDANTDSYKDQHVRRVLASLDGLARATSCAIVYVMHLTKGAGSNPLQRIAGSIAFTAAARSVVLMTPETTPQAPERIIAHVKCNVAEKAVAQRWAVRPMLLPGSDNGRDVRTARLDYLGVAEVDVFMLLAPRAEPDEARKIDRACELIEQYLTMGSMQSRELMVMLDEHGIGERTAKAARERMGVEVEKRGKAWWCLSLSQSKSASGKSASPPLPPSFARNHAGSPPSESTRVYSEGEYTLPSEGAAQESSQTPTERGSVEWIAQASAGDLAEWKREVLDSPG